MIQTKYCTRCGKLYEKPKSCRGKRWTNRLYCSSACQRSAAVDSSARHRVITPAGRQRMADRAKAYIENETPEQRKARMAKVLESRNRNGIWIPPATGKIGELRTNIWLGDDASYNAKHRWIQKHWVKTGICTYCGKKPRPFGNRRYGTEWANLDGKYNRDDKTTWAELCKSCHVKLDAK